MMSGMVRNTHAGVWAADHNSGLQRDDGALAKGACVSDILFLEPVWHV